MKKGTYDLVSTIAVVLLALSAYFAQHSRHAGYAFGFIAVLSAVGSLATYVKALLKESHLSSPREPAPREADLVIPGRLSIRRTVFHSERWRGWGEAWRYRRIRARSAAMDHKAVGDPEEVYKDGLAMFHALIPALRRANNVAAKSC
ncbi:MAG: hypothetical protein ABR874_23715 [Candidatus Sulfotelmatobacter sp.]|jgi:hypothetical protein